MPAVVGADVSLRHCAVSAARHPNTAETPPPLTGVVVVVVTNLAGPAAAAQLYVVAASHRTTRCAILPCTLTRRNATRRGVARDAAEH